MILGIDTGGTFTDGVLLDEKTGELLSKAKASTTRYDLSIGIGECIEKCIDGLKGNHTFDEIQLVCLSTTLATNSVVEGKQSRVGLISMCSDYLNESFVTDYWYKILGKISITGEVLEELDENEVIAALREMKGGIDSLVVSGYAAVRNPVHELKVKTLARQELDIPVICAHELSMSLGFNERTVTAVMNSHLMPVIDDLIKKLKNILERKGIGARLLVVKGDGTMMSEVFALERPIETVLSGPAASVIGASNLIEINDAIVIDLGGTTLDIADMSNGKVTIYEEGAVVNGWQTRVKAIDIHTFGLGGDSRLHIEKEGIKFGPEKAIPICFACEKYNYLLDEIVKYSKSKNPTISGFNKTEALWLNAGEVKKTESDFEKKIISILSNGPHSVGYVASRLSRAQQLLGLNEMMKKGIIVAVSITPTDLIHITGEFVRWNRIASEKILELISEQYATDKEEMIIRLSEIFLDQISFAIIRGAFELDGRGENFTLDTSLLYQAIFSPSRRIQLIPQLKKKIIALGAPADVWIKRLEKRLQTEVIVPEHAEVANAVGAAKGIISEYVEIVVRYDQLEKEYRVHTPWEMTRIRSLMDVRKYVNEQIEKYVDFLKETTEVNDYIVNIDERIRTLFEDGENENFDMDVTAVISTRPECFCTNIDMKQNKLV